MTKQYDLVVIGSGPAGEVGAIRAAQLGLSVAIVEKRAHLGGTCLNVGCIPTKSLLQSAKTWYKLQSLDAQGFEVDGTIAYNWAKILERKNKVVDDQRKGLRFLMKKNKIDVIQGVAKMTNKYQVTVYDPENTDKTIDVLGAKFVLLATGSRVRDLPTKAINHRNILSSDSILDIEKVPESLAVIGGGVVGTEFASMFARMGSKVSIIELAPRILPSEDDEVVKEFMRHLKKQSIDVRTATKLTHLKDLGHAVEVSTEGQETQKFDKVLVAIGREPVTDDIGLEAIGVSCEKGGFIPVNSHYQTSAEHIYAVGDIIKTPALAHTASAEAMHAVEHLAGKHAHLINYDANPNAVYTYPEIASLGKTEEQLKSAGVEYKVAKFPFAPMAKAKIEDAAFGFVKILFEPKYREILGVHIIGAIATELIAEFALGKVLETTIDEIGHTVHPHPTISEAVMEAAHSADGQPIHM